MTPRGSLSLLGLSLVGAGLLWRYASRRRELPCPPWLAWSLTNPLTDRLWNPETTLNRVGLRPGQRVLEVGPGPGRLLVPAARRVLPGGSVVGLELQPGMVSRLRERAAREGVRNLTAVLGDATQPHLEPESFDVVFLSTVLGEIPDRATALRECYRVLKPGGWLSVTEILPDPHYQSPAEVRRVAEGVGFRFEEMLGPWYRYTMNFMRGEGGVQRWRL